MESPAASSSTLSNAESSDSGDSPFGYYVDRPAIPPTALSDILRAAVPAVEIAGHGYAPDMNLGLPREVSRALHNGTLQVTDIANIIARVFRLIGVGNRVPPGHVRSLRDFSRYTLLPGDPIPPLNPIYIAKSDMASYICCTERCPDAPLRHAGWESWLASCHSLATTQIQVLSNPTIVHGEMYLLARLLTRLVPRMSWYEAMMNPIQFHGWFPSSLLFDFLARDGAYLTQHEMNKAVSLVQMLPILTVYPNQLTVPMVRIYHHTVGIERLTFVSLHPTLKEYTYAPEGRAM